MLGAGNRDDVLILRQHPGQRELRGFAAFLPGDFLDAAHEVEILLKVLALKARRISAVVVLREIYESRELAGEKAAPERTVGDEAYADFAAGVQDVVFWMAAPGRSFRSQRPDWT